MHCIKKSTLIEGRKDGRKVEGWKEQASLSPRRMSEFPCHTRKMTISRSDGQSAVVGWLVDLMEEKEDERTKAAGVKARARLQLEMRVIIRIKSRGKMFNLRCGIGHTA